jgi:hypothetical protein
MGEDAGEAPPDSPVGVGEDHLHIPGSTHG